MFLGHADGLNNPLFEWKMTQARANAVAPSLIPRARLLVKCPVERIGG